MFAGVVNDISVIIPTRNEADNLPATVETLRAGGIEDILVVDGASNDGTPDVADKLGCRVFVESEADRAMQMNLGATVAKGEILLFLHADTIVGKESIRTLRETMRDQPEVVGGAFSRRFDSSSALLRTTCHWADWRGRKYGIFLGDQGIFVLRPIFDRIGGFDENFGPGEDIDFTIRLGRVGRTALIGPPVISSARRFERRGALLQTVSDLFEARNLIAKSKAKMRI